MNREVLAWRKYPEPDGRSYYREDLENPFVLKELFDYCQILEAAIFEAGWRFLIGHYPISRLYEINRKSGWFDADSPDEFEKALEDYWEELGYQIL